MKDNFQFSIFNFQLFYRFLLWRDKHIKEKHFILIVSFLVGICTAAAAIVLKSIIHFIQHLLTGNFNQDGANYLYLLYPVIGILLAGLFVKYIVRDDISHGVTKILYAISQRKSRIKPHNAWTSIVASSVTIGFGGSVGAEAPIVLTGAAIGSNLGRLFRMEQKTLMLLVGCGAAGAIAGIFKAPIAGVVFVVEVLLLDLTMTSVLPLLITSVTAATVSYIFTGTEAMFPFSQTEAFVIERIPYVLLLGVFCGLVSLYFTKVMNRVEGMYRNLNNYWKKFVVGGIMLSVLIFIFPPLYGEGYDTISSLLNGQFSHIMDKSMFYSLNDTYWGLQIFLTLILLFKVFASSATNAGGGCGGIFGMHCRIRVCACVQLFSLYDVSVGEELRLVGNGGYHVRCHACAADRCLPNCRADRRVCSFPSTDDRICELLYHDQDVSSTQYLFDASGPERGVAYPS